VIDLLIEPGADLPRTRTEGNVTILPILEEVVVVEKRLRLKEEVRITKRVTNELTQTPITVRKQRVVIERLNSEGGPVTETEESYEMTQQMVSAVSIDARSIARSPLVRTRSENGQSKPRRTRKRPWCRRLPA
jgi:stress response protein YsnF